MERKFWQVFDLKRLCLALNTGRGALVLIGLLLAFAGGVSVWIYFPLSSPVGGFSLSYFDKNDADESVIISQGLGFLILVGGAAVAILMRQKLISHIMLFLALVALLYFPTYLLFIDTGWIVQYIREADQYIGLRSFLSKYFIPNTGVEFPTSYITGFDFIFERFQVVLAVLSWGWILALIGVAMTIINLTSVYVRGIPAGALSIVMSLIVSIFLAIVLGFNVIYANYLHNQGDILLSQGDYAKAIDSYEAALRKDPAIKYSEIFLLNVSSAYLAMEGRDHPFAQLYVSEEYSKRLLPNEAALHLQYFMSYDPLDSIFTSALVSQSLRKMANIYLKSGVVFYSNENRISALNDFEKALAVDRNLLTGNFFRAKILLDLRKHEDCKNIMEKLVDQVDRASVKANFYSTLAECYTGMGDYNRARDAYFSSFKLDDRENYWALKGLSGT